MGDPLGNVLITGGLGYVGGRIASHLIASAPKISLRLMTHRSHIQTPAWASDLDVVQSDITNEASLAAAVDGIDTVIHLAALNENDSGKDADLALEVNGRGTHKLLDACVAKKVRRFIYFSTFHVYGPSAPKRITEETATRPIHPYAFSHRYAEDLVNWFRQRREMETLIFRLSNGYGYPADAQVNRWTLVFNDFCRQAVETGQLQLRSKGMQHRDFISLNDVASATSHFLRMVSGQWGDGLFNLGGQCSMSIKQVADQVAAEFLETSGKPTPVILGDAEDSQGAEPVDFNVDKLMDTGFQLTGNMREEIRATLELCARMNSKGAKAD